MDWYYVRDDLIFPDEALAPRQSVQEEEEEERRRRDAETNDIVANALASRGIKLRRRRRP